MLVFLVCMDQHVLWDCLVHLFRHLDLEIWRRWSHLSLGLCGLMTPGLSKDIQCHLWLCFSKLANHQIRWSAWWLHMVTLIFNRALCGYDGLTHSFYHPQDVITSEQEHAMFSIVYFTTEHYIVLSVEGAYKFQELCIEEKRPSTGHSYTACIWH